MQANCSENITTLGSPAFKSRTFMSRNFPVFRITVIIVLAFIVLIAVGLLLQRTKLGTAMRAVADNRDLAESSGIDVKRTILAVWITGSALAALGGILLGATLRRARVDHDLVVT